MIKLEIRDLKIDAIIGIHGFEKSKKQPLIIDLDIYYNASQAMISDDIEHAIDYYNLTKDLSDYISKSQFELLETLSYKILEIISKNKKIKKASLTIAKPKALKDFGAMVKITNEYNNI